MPDVPKLVLREVTRSYGAVRALTGATVTVRAGTVHAVLGENGAGKSTLMKIAFGLERPDSGSIELDGVPVRWRSPREAMARGIGMVQQHFALVPAMTVAENVVLGGTGRYSVAESRALVMRVSAAAGLPLDPDALVRDLPVGAQQRLEIVKALSRDATLLILDEPTAVLAPAEVEELFAWIRRFTASGGTVLLIAHKLREVLSVADDVTVLRRGRTVLAAGREAVDVGVVTQAMLGTGAVGAPSVPARDVASAAVASASPQPAAPAGPPVLALRGVSVTDARGVRRLDDVSLSVQRGEIVGIAAIEGAGQHELLRVLADRMAVTRGTVVRPASLGFVPEDRQRDAVLLDGTLTETVALRGLGARRGVMPWGALAARTRELVAAYDVRTTGAVVVRALSGGNQQKLVLARELADSPEALIVENPTRGLDIRATADVHAALRRARDEGAGVVVYSSDLDEVLSLADRILVMHNGRVLSVEHDREAVGRAMLGGAAA